MGISFFIRCMILIASLLLSMEEIARATQPVDQPLAATSEALSTESDAASGAVEDTLKSCITRIPKDASIGQRMIAVESCQRDDVDRKPIQAVPDAEHVSQ
jgi:hypothetical protein